MLLWGGGGNRNGGTGMTQLSRYYPCHGKFWTVSETDSLHCSSFVEGTPGIVLAKEVCYIAHEMVAIVLSLSAQPRFHADASASHMDRCWDSICAKHMQGPLSYAREFLFAWHWRNYFKCHACHCMKTKYLNPYDIWHTMGMSGIQLQHLLRWDTLQPGVLCCHRSISPHVVGGWSLLTSPHGIIWDVSSRILQKYGLYDFIY